MARAFNGVQMVVLVGAGVGAFYAVAHLSRQAQDNNDSIVAAATHPAVATRASVIGPAPRPSDAALRTSIEQPQAPASAASGTAATPDALGDRSTAIPGSTGQPFAAMSWLPPPPPPPRPVVVVAAPPAPPVAPPLPFTFVGMVEQGTPKPQAFLSRGDELLVVSAGDLLDHGAYRVDAMNAGQIVFIHLPTNTKQVITLSGGSQ